MGSPTTAVERPRVLFVEDEASIAEPFARALTRAGFEPTVATTGHDAIELAGQHPTRTSSCSTSACPTPMGSTCAGSSSATPTCRS